MWAATFPAGELTLPENRDSLARLDFAAIKARRGSDWSVAPPRLSSAMRANPQTSAHQTA